MLKFTQLKSALNTLQIKFFFKLHNLKCTTIVAFRVGGLIQYNTQIQGQLVSKSL